MSIIFAILIFSFLIFIHEFGHFITAKMSGVQVNEFSMFMGPAIWKKQKGETLYAIRCIPIGGYCAMEGEDDETDNPRAFRKAAWWKRLIILVSGAGMNFIAGVLIMLIVAMPIQQIVLPTVASFEEGCTLNADGGLQVGDTILEVDGEKIYVQNDFSVILTLNPSDRHDLVVLRNGEKVYLNNFLMEKHTFVNEDGSASERFGFSFSISDPLTFAQKLEYGWKNALNAGRTVRLSLQMLLSGQAGISDMSGPVGIIDQMNDVASASETWWLAMLNLLYFGGIIAINLAIMNLLPIPALDGGRVVSLLLTTVIEAVTHKKLNPKYEGYVHAAGMIVLLGLMAVIMFKDIIFIFK